MSLFHKYVYIDRCLSVSHTHTHAHTHAHILCLLHTRFHAFFFFFSFLHFDVHTHKHILQIFTRTQTGRLCQKKKRKIHVRSAVRGLFFLSPSWGPYGRHSCNLVPCSLYVRISPERFIPSLLDLQSCRWGFWWVPIDVGAFRQPRHFNSVILARHPSCQPPMENIFIYSWDSITNFSFSSFRFRRQLEATTANRLFKKQNKEERNSGRDSERQLRD